MASAERVKYFLANVKDKPGALLKIMQDLKGRDIGLTGLWAFGVSGGKAQVYAVPKNPAKLRYAWKTSKLVTEEGWGFFVKGTDRTGALLPTLEALANAGINIVAIDAISVGGKYGSFIWVDKKDVSKAEKAFGLK